MDPYKTTHWSLGSNTEDPVWTQTIHQLFLNDKSLSFHGGIFCLNVSFSEQTYLRSFSASENSVQVLVYSRSYDEKFIYTIPEVNWIAKKENSYLTPLCLWISWLRINLDQLRFSSPYFLHNRRFAHVSWNFGFTTHLTTRNLISRPLIGSKHVLPSVVPYLRGV